MNLEQFEYIAAIARTGSITIAAEQLHVSQAGISKSLSKLEQELGITIFKRSRLGTVPTDRGKIIIEKVFEILARMEEIREQSLVKSSLTEGEVRFSVGPNFMAVLTKAIIAFKRDHPNVKLEITSKSTEEVIQDLKEDRTDLGLIYLDNHKPEDVKDLQMKTLHVSRMVVCVGRRSSLVMNKSVTPQDLLAQPFVNIDGVFSNWYLGDFMDKYGQVNLLFTSNNIELLKRTIAEGAAVGLFIEYAMMHDPLVLNGDIVMIPLVSHEPSTISLGWARLAKKHFSIAQKEFLNYLIREYNSFK
ncbi:LysR family transcriptional regulator [Paenibacillus radicis (ex Gao et al. 2016)]|uniref:LysR family transcriptional regulator n=1 Tax=Paenibacillus radicis (ex Gao et al. 2016) TaxID=1737354 RepID=A0A917HAS5_9BACL|nr:LysR family transcriptional regulator [Paenibacillus radicis (ex Gao et al. 2016)]GGG73099.1 LysR family transcriptional regulator [Paenibacillus radicis (ex Gao et al. 2016)]